MIYRDFGRLEFEGWVVPLTAEHYAASFARATDIAIGPKPPLATFLCRRSAARESGPSLRLQSSATAELAEFRQCFRG